MQGVRIICVLMPILFATTTYAAALDYGMAKAVSKQHRARERGVARRHCEAGGRCGRRNRKRAPRSGRPQRGLFCTRWASRIAQMPTLDLHRR